MKKSFAILLLLLTLAASNFAQKAPSEIPINVDGSCPANYYRSENICLYGQIPTGNRSALPEDTGKAYLLWTLLNLIEFFPAG